jgi:hypothetical protein
LRNKSTIWSDEAVGSNDSKLYQKQNFRVTDAHLDTLSWWKELRKQWLLSQGFESPRDVEDSQSSQSGHKWPRNDPPPSPTEILLSALNDAYSTLHYRRPPRRLAHCHERYSATSLDRLEKLSLQVVLSRYITTLDAHLSRKYDLRYHGSNHISGIDEALGWVFDNKTLLFLSTKGYSVQDLMAWTWILKAHKPYLAALRLLSLENHYAAERNDRPRRVPFFIVKILLHRENLDLNAFRVLLAYCLAHINQQPIPAIASAVKQGLEAMECDTGSISERSGKGLDASIAMSLVTLLLDHARRLWPVVQFNIARSFALFLTCATDHPSAGFRKKERLNRLRTRYFNTCLSMLSIPSKHSPFLSTSTQQRAQFELLKAMAAHDPVLPVSRAGYQAVVAVQLAHKKTEAERRYADYKAPSWPPWKSDRLGIDSKRGSDGMKSRAMQVMSQMKDAGYSFTLWEDVASILAGWDVDGSPTIQTRRLASPTKFLQGPSKSSIDDPAIWAARIRATRTLREAWACFLSHQDQNLLPSEIVYHAIAEKLAFRRIAMERDFDRNNTSLPGDGLEVFAEPASQRDVIYVRTEPPSLEDFIKQMVSQGIRPGPRFLAFLLGSSKTFHSGLNYLACSTLSTRQLKALCLVWPGTYDSAAMYTLKRLRKMEPRLFHAFIKFLCKFSNFDSIRFAGITVGRADTFPILMGKSLSGSTRGTLFSYGHGHGEVVKTHHPRTLHHAVHLLRNLKPRQASVWLMLLQALAAPRMSSKDRMTRRDLQKFLTWHEVLEVVRWMARIDVEPGMQGLLILCKSYTNFVSAGIRDPTAAEEGLSLINEMKRQNEIELSSTPRTFEESVYEGLHVLKSHFDRLVLPQPEMVFDQDRAGEESDDDDAKVSDLPIPFMLQVPTPVVLHAFVRALGAAEDYDGVINLLQWMSRCAPALKECADELSNGERMMRRTLAAVRVFLEGTWDVEALRRAHHDSEADTRLIERTDGSSLPSDQDSVPPEFSDPYVEEAYKIIERTEVWGPWPTDAEVRQYLLWRSAGH